jgi:hypothetical protein
MNVVTINQCRLFNLPVVNSRNGSLTALNELTDVPFEIKRVFYQYDIPTGVSRGGHAHKSCHEFLVAVSGSFEVMLDDGADKKVVALDRPDIALHIPPTIWLEERNFSSGSICLVLASEFYDRADYIREYKEFLKLRG